MLHPIRVSILQRIYQLKPFDIKGDLQTTLLPQEQGKVSCIIPYIHKKLLNDLIEDINKQDLPASQIEIIPIHSADQRLGYLRNLGLAKARGEFILFLDDDTRIFQANFLKEALRVMQENQSDTLIPQGLPLFCYRNNKSKRKGIY